MAHWKDAAVTNDGVEMLNEWMAGRFIKITSAYGGTGTVDAAFLTEQTDLVERRQKLHLLGEEDNAEGKTVQIQVSNAEVMEEYELNQVGVYAKLDPERDPDAEERLLFIMQDQKGVTIPSSMDASFMLELYAMIGITNNGRFDVSLSSAGIATVSAIEEAVKEHDASPEAHRCMAARIGAVETALNGGETIGGDGDPTVETKGVKGQHYINSVTGEEFVCTEVTEDGCTWEPKESVATNVQNLAARVQGIEAAVNGGETIGGDGDPTIETKGVKGQHYINSETGEEFVCTNVEEDRCIWEPWETVDKSIFASQPRLHGQPGQVVGFDGMGLARAVDGWSNQNLLDNAYWASKDCIINQLGQEEYTSNDYSHTYTIDRLSIYGTGVTLTIEDGDIVLRNQSTAQGGMTEQLKLSQFYGLLGKTISLSILYKLTGSADLCQWQGWNNDGAQSDYAPFLQVIPESSEWNVITTTGRVEATGTGSIKNYGGLFIHIEAGSELRLKAAKLEKGPVQTLAHQDADGSWVLNDPPDYNLQYLLCSQYSPITGEWVGSQHSNPNLLDNSYFADPVNQRGQTEYSGTGYTIDRWQAMTNPAKVTIEDDCIKIENTTDVSTWYGQYGELTLLKALAGKAATVSALYRAEGEGNDFYCGYAPNGGTFIGTGGVGGLISDGTWRLAQFASGIPEGLDNVAYYAPGSFMIGAHSTLWLKAAKVELGSQQTLAHQDEEGNWVLNDPPPSKALETLKCQRYYHVFATQSLRPTKAEDFCPPMRINPTLGTIEIDGVTYYTADANL